MPTRFAIDKKITLGELRFHYRDWNGMGWPVLFLHGLASSSHIWDLVAPLVVEDARVIAPDMRGHGQSDKPDADYDFETITGDIRALLEEVQFERPVIVGHSWGAQVGLWLAATYPDEVSGLIMVDGGLWDLGGSMTWEETLQTLRPPTIDGMPVEKFRQMIQQNTPEGLLNPAVEAAIMANFEITPEETIKRRLPVEYHLRILRAMWEARNADLLKSLSCPVLAIMARWEGRDDPQRLAVKTQAAEKAQALLADGEVIWLEETIHDIPLQRPEELAEKINQFLQEEI